MVSGYDTLCRGFDGKQNDCVLLKRRNLKNKMHSISPRLEDGNWLFDDKSRNLQDELLVSGADYLCDLTCDKLKIIPHRGFTINFSDSLDDLPDAPDFTLRLLGKCDQSHGGFFYIYDDLAVWLCDNLLAYFDNPPDNIYISVVESKIIREAKELVKKAGFQLVWCSNYNLIEPFIVRLYLDGMEKFASTSPNIDWINYHVVDLTDSIT